jgi:signal transduction histidine kinase
MTLFKSLTNRIFLGSALLAVVSIAIAIYNVNVAVSDQAEKELGRGLDEAGSIIEEYQRVLVDHFTREARLVADLPRLKAAVDTNDATTVHPIAEHYQQELKADLMLVTGRQDRTLAEIASGDAATGTYASLPGVRTASKGLETSSFWPHRGGILQVVTVPILIGLQQPEILGTLSVGFSLDNSSANRFRSLTNSDIAFGIDGAIRASTLDPALWPALTALLARDGLWQHVPAGDQDYIAKTRSLSATISSSSGEGSPDRSEAQRARVLVLRSRTERLGFLNPLHGRLGIIAVVAVLAATLLSYAIARTITRPLGTITATMREMAATGDLTRRIAPPSGGAMWEDEDARLLVTTFNTMTDSIARFQREAAQRERLSSLGRLSTVVAHEIRNPLMIIKTALRAIRGPNVKSEEVRAAVADIDEETARLNRLVSEVLDFAKPIKFEHAPTDLNALCEDAARAAGSDAAGIAIRLDLDPTLPPIVTDGERLRVALVNILTNARHAVDATGGSRATRDSIKVRTRRHAGDRITIDVRDQGTGIAPEDMTRVFDPYFTTRRTGTGLGLAISRNIIEGLGGTISMSSRQGDGTEVHIELPGGPAEPSSAGR